LAKILKINGANDKNLYEKQVLKALEIGEIETIGN